MKKKVHISFKMCETLSGWFCGISSFFPFSTNSPHLVKRPAVAHDELSTKGESVIFFGLVTPKTILLLPDSFLRLSLHLFLWRRRRRGI